MKHLFWLVVVLLGLWATSTHAQMLIGKDGGPRLNLDNPAGWDDWSLIVIYNGKPESLTRNELRDAVNRKLTAKVPQ